MIHYFVRGALHMYPPCMSQIQWIQDCGEKVRVYCGECDEHVEILLRSRGIEVVDYKIKRTLPGALGALQSVSLYRKLASKTVAEIDYEDQLWFGTADSAFLIKEAISGRKYALCSLELYDDNLRYRKGIESVVGGARAFIVCESNRAWLMRSWWDLAETPFVLPNKPYSHTRKRETMPQDCPWRERMRLMPLSKKIILYQGIISSDRDLSAIAEAVGGLGDEFALVLMGKEIDAGVASLRERCPDLIYLGHIPAPFHLYFTSYAHVGIACYNPINLNNVFCAPNKIYEYSGFGIPMVCSDNPGLASTVGAAGAAVCTDTRDARLVGAALIEVFSSYDEFSYRAEKFYNSVDNTNTVQTILYRLKS